MIERINNWEIADWWRTIYQSKNKIVLKNKFCLKQWPERIFRQSKWHKSMKLHQLTIDLRFWSKSSRKREFQSLKIFLPFCSRRKKYRLKWMAIILVVIISMFDWINPLITTKISFFYVHRPLNLENNLNKLLVHLKIILFIELISIQINWSTHVIN